MKWKNNKSNKSNNAVSLSSCEMDGATHHEWMQRKKEWAALVSFECILWFRKNSDRVSSSKSCGRWRWCLPFGMHLLILKCSFMICVGLKDRFSGIHIYIYIHMFQSGLESLSDVINSFFYIPFHPLPSRCILLHSKERSQNSNKIKLLMFGLLFC